MRSRFSSTEVLWARPVEASLEGLFIAWCGALALVRSFVELFVYAFLALGVCFANGYLSCIEARGFVGPLLTGRMKRYGYMVLVVVYLSSFYNILELDMTSTPCFRSRL
nr:hypothetical protein Iba_chr01aCG0830 [Ipomoea batatas]